MDEVKAGRDGWLFLTGGSNQAWRFFTEPDFMSEAHVQGWVERITQRAEWAAAVGAQYLHAFAPDKISIYGEYLGLDLPFFSLRPNELIRQAINNAGLQNHFVDIEAAMRSTQGKRLYHLTDTHWTAQGTYLALKTICDRMGYKPTFVLEDLIVRDRVTAGDIGRKFDPPIMETMKSYRVTRNASQEYANALVDEGSRQAAAFPAGLLSGSYIVMRNASPEAHDAKVLIFGDSFCEVRPGQGLTMMMAECFREVHFFWSSSVDRRQIERIRPDFVISELAERFARVVPNDERDLDEYAASRIADYRRSNAKKLV